LTFVSDTTIPGYATVPKGAEVIGIYIDEDQRMKRPSTLRTVEGASQSVTGFEYSVDCKPIDFQWEINDSSSLTSSYTRLGITSGGIVAFLMDALLDNKQNEEFHVYGPGDNSGGAATDCGDAPEDDFGDMSGSSDEDDTEVLYEESSDDEDDASSDETSASSDEDDAAEPVLRKVTTDEDKRDCLDVIVGAFEEHGVAMEEGFFYTIEGDTNPELSWDKEILLQQYEVYMFGDTVGMVVENKTASFAVLHLIGSTKKGDGQTALRKLLDDLAKKKTPMTIALEAIDGATTGQKVVDCYRAAGFETIGTVPMDKTGDDWEETVAKLVAHGGVENGAALRAWANRVAPNSIIMCKKM